MLCFALRFDSIRFDCLGPAVEQPNVMNSKSASNPNENGCVRVCAADRAGAGEDRAPEGRPEQPHERRGREQVRSRSTRTPLLLRCFAFPCAVPCPSPSRRLTSRPL